MLALHVSQHESSFLSMLRVLNMLQMRLLLYILTTVYLLVVQKWIIVECLHCWKNLVMQPCKNDV